ncbi:MAG TPA: SRPBCC family protein, partial [Ilumatobacteraceae bacterium]|nr:SRPBCC family protein [Ilumatobacteraceae bacterium]
METLTNSIVIAAPAAVVWNLTIDVANWPSVTPTMTSVERLDDGPFGIGSKARVKQPMQRPTTWTVTEFDPERRFAW